MTHFNRTVTVDLRVEIEWKIIPAETDAETDCVYAFIDIEGESSSARVPIRDLDGWFDTDERTETEKRANVARAFRELADRIERG